MLIEGEYSPVDALEPHAVSEGLREGLRDYDVLGAAGRPFEPDGDGSPRAEVVPDGHSGLVLVVWLAGAAHLGDGTA